MSQERLHQAADNIHSLLTSFTSVSLLNSGPTEVCEHLMKTNGTILRTFHLNTWEKMSISTWCYILMSADQIWADEKSRLLQSVWREGGAQIYTFTLKTEVRCQQSLMWNYSYLKGHKRGKLSINPVRPADWAASCSEARVKVVWWFFLLILCDMLNIPPYSYKLGLHSQPRV